MERGQDLRPIDKYMRNEGQTNLFETLLLDSVLIRNSRDRSCHRSYVIN